MPQIRCPNCGTNINLKARRELDYRMILSVMEKGSKSFTDLLKITGLPRKTLSLRLTALCDSGIIAKDGGYRLSGVPYLEQWGKKLGLSEGQTLAKPPFFTRRNVLIILMLVVIGGPIAANVSAMLFQSSPPSVTPPPKYIDTFMMDIKVYNITDLSSWQTMIHFDESELVFIDVVEGPFLNASAPYGTVFLFANDTGPGELVVFATLMGMNVPGVGGTGTLATMTFGYKSSNYRSPTIVYDDTYETFLWNSNLKDTEGTLALEIREG